MFKNKNVLVTGGAGFVASNLILKLLELEANVTATWHIKSPQINDSRITYNQTDLMEKENCLTVCHNMDYVFMCAANTSGAAVIEKKPLTHVTPNVVMNAYMLEAAYECGVKKFLSISSNTVYPVTDYPVKEIDTGKGELFEKYFCVASMKLFFETLCRMYATKIKKTMTTVIIRPANIYGPYDDFEWETSHMIAALIRKSVEKKNPFEVWGDGTDRKDYIYIDDFIAGALLAFEKTDRFDIYNIASGNSVSVKEVVSTILQADDNAAKVQFDPSKPSMIPLRLIDISKAENQLGFVPETSLSTGLKKSIAWYRQNKELHS